MNSTSDTRITAEEIGRQAIQGFHSDQQPMQPYLDFLEYKNYLRSQNTEVDVEALIGGCSIDFGNVVQRIVQN